jgi:hypothetical protein
MLFGIDREVIEEDMKMLGAFKTSVFHALGRPFAH